MPTSSALPPGHEMPPEPGALSAATTGCRRPKNPQNRAANSRFPLTPPPLRDPFHLPPQRPAPEPRAGAPLASGAPRRTLQDPAHRCCLPVPPCTAPVPQKAPPAGVPLLLGHSPGGLRRAPGGSGGLPPLLPAPAATHLAAHGSGAAAASGVRASSSSSPSSPFSSSSSSSPPSPRGTGPGGEGAWPTSG